MMFAGRQRQEKCQKKNTDLYFTHVDLTKAFDIVSSDGLWRIMAKYGCLSKFISVIRQFLDEMMAQFYDNTTISEPFPVSNGVKQGCVLSSTLLSLSFSAMLTEAFRNQA